MQWLGVVVTVLLLTGCTSTPGPEDSADQQALPSVSPVAERAPEPVRVELASFVGGKVCAECHAAEAAAWAESNHDHAMQIASDETVLGDFKNTSFTDAGVTTRFLEKDGAFFVRAVGPDGSEDDFPVPYVFGVHPLQQYLVDIGGGRLQAHPVAWDVEEKAWISLYPGEEIPLDDPLHWTRFGLNWNQGCADCHSTNLRKQYSEESNSYETVWSEINVSCEACHGPGEAHVGWARGELGEPSSVGSKGLANPLEAGAFMRRNDAPGRDRVRQQSQIDTCAPCHARRAVIHPVDAWGVPLTEAYRPEVLRNDLYHPDGQILEEVYVYGSFVQSRMFQEGVVCTDCHDPHSLELVAEGNALCTQCHAPATYDVEEHTHHAAGSDGATCVACHMVETTYMQVDPRRDHGFHIPRPDLTIELAVPNACNRCHEDESAQWARDHVVRWYGPERPDDIHEARALAAGGAGAPGSSKALAEVAGNPDRPPIVRATALHFLQGGDGVIALGAARAALEDPDPLVRSLGVVTLAAQARSMEDLEALIPLLDDESRLVRTEAAVSLSRVAGQRFSSGAPGKEAFDAALAEYLVGQKASADQPAAQMNLGVVAQNLGDDAAARAFYEQARRIEPAFVPARFNLAMLDATSGRSTEAEAGFLDVIRLAPELSQAKYSLGLLLAEDRARLEDSARWLGAAARDDPENARFQYNAGLSAQHLGRTAEAEAYLRTAVNLEPDDPEFRNALAILYVQQARWAEALPQAERLRELVGESPEVDRFVESIRERIR